MFCAPFLSCGSLPVRRWAAVACLLLGVTGLAGCAGQANHAVRGSDAYVVVFSATHPVDHTGILSISVPVELGREARVKATVHTPLENRPALTDFIVRLNRARQPGVYEMVTRVTAREALRNKKGKLKVGKRFLGALVPTRLGETQVVSAEGDPIHLEARLEKR